MDSLVPPIPDQWAELCAFYTPDLRASSPRRHRRRSVVAEEIFDGQATIKTDASRMRAHTQRQPKLHSRTNSDTCTYIYMHSA